MPPQFLFDISSIDLSRVEVNRDGIQQIIPHRGDILQLDGIIYGDKESGRLLGFKDVRNDEFWVTGHIPGRPLLPGVLMIEAGAQLASVWLKRYLQWDGFVGFGGVDKVRFRQQVTPGQRMYILLQRVWIRHGRFCGDVQGIVDGNLVFEAQVIGVALG
jgi:3-hydroxyacyl-[acyl-carrier-protein] dehydratase